MIINWIIDVALGFVAWLGSLFPVWDIPPALAAPGTLVNQVMGSFLGLGAWVDWGVLGAVAIAVVGTWLVMFGVKLVMKLVSYLPFVGGSG